MAKPMSPSTMLRPDNVANLRRKPSLLGTSRRSNTDRGQNFRRADFPDLQVWSFLQGDADPKCMLAGGSPVSIYRGGFVPPENGRKFSRRLHGWQNTEDFGGSELQKCTVNRKGISFTYHQQPMNRITLPLRPRSA